jgi:pimeloyl-ACP methyl ester carboxylesterase
MLLSALTTALCLLDSSPQDLVFLKTSRKPLRGSVTAQTDAELVFNPYYSTHAEMVWGVETFAKKKVRSVKTDVPPRDDFWLRLHKAKNSADELFKLAEFCKKKRLKDECLVALEWALLADAAHVATRKVLGSSKADAFLARDPATNQQLSDALDAYLKNDDRAARVAKAKGLIKQYRLKWDVTYFERAYRSNKQPRGTTRDRKLTMRKDEIPGVYTLYVPDSYDPFRPTALILLLHGGGQEGDKVIGSGRAACSQFSGSLRNLNYIAVCPTALRAPWRSAINDPWIRALLAEAEALFNVDLNCVYVAGHSMGGYGTWHFGPKYCDRFAAIGAMCGGGSNGLKNLRDTNTFVYLYHGGDDTRVRPGNSQATAKRMLKDGNDFVYTQLPNKGHSCPRSAIEEMFTFFARKRLTVKKRIQARTRSSFFAKQTRDEIKYFGKLKTR